MCKCRYLKKLESKQMMIDSGFSVFIAEKEKLWSEQIKMTMLNCYYLEFCKVWWKVKKNALKMHESWQYNWHIIPCLMILLQFLPFYLLFFCASSANSKENFDFFLGFLITAPHNTAKKMIFNYLFDWQLFFLFVSVYLFQFWTILSQKRISCKCVCVLCVYIFRW